MFYWQAWAYMAILFVPMIFAIGYLLKYDPELLGHRLKLKELHSLSTEELNKQLETAREELFNLRFKLATKQLVNHRELPKAKKQIARLQTLIRERELGIRQV